MKVLDATFLADYLADVDTATQYLEEHSTERFVIPAPAFAEALVGEGTGRDSRRDRTSDTDGCCEFPVEQPPGPPIVR